MYIALPLLSTLRVFPAGKPGLFRFPGRLETRGVVVNERSMWNASLPPLTHGGCSMLVTAFVICQTSRMKIGVVK